MENVIFVGGMMMQSRYQKVSARLTVRSRAPIYQNEKHQ